MGKSRENWESRKKEESGKTGESKKRGKRGKWLLPAGLLLASGLLNAAAWGSDSFADWYVRHVFPLWSETYGRLTGLAPFSVGEVMIVAGIVWMAAAAGAAVTAAVLRLRAAIGRIGKDRENKGKQEENSEAAGASESVPAARREEKSAAAKSSPRCSRAYRGAARFLYATGVLLSAVLLVMTLNCFILYQAAGLGDVREGKSEREQAVLYSAEQLALVRDHIVTRANELAQSVPRDAQGEVIFPERMDETAAAAMRALAASFPQLSGYYPPPKEMFFSDLMSQSYMQGYYFPFSMEANYNTTMARLNVPYTMCHELSHLKGYILEDDANMLAFLACIGSDDAAFVYSGYLGVLNYVNNDFYEAIGKNPQTYAAHPAISEQVRADNAFLTDDAWKKVEQKAVVPTQTARAVSAAFTETTLQANGVREGMKSYNQVVERLMDYYLTTEPLGAL